MKNICVLLFSLISLSLSARDFINEEKAEGLSITSTSSVLSSKCAGFDRLFDGTVLKDEESRGFVLENPFGVVLLAVPQSENYGADVSAKLTFDVTYIYEDNGLQYTETITGVELTVNANGTSFKDMDYIKINDALKVDVQVTNVEVTGDDANQTFYSNLVLTSSCRGAYHDLLSQQSVVTGLKHETNTASSGPLFNGNLRVVWDQNISDEFGIKTPEAFELEWTYLSDPEEDGEVYLRDYLFRNNSSRVVVMTNTYDIPLVYEKGIIVFRVRALGKYFSGNKLVDVKTKWTYEEQSTNLSLVNSDHMFTFEGLDINLNWQSTITFAEEGKNKAVVTFHDGTLRNRQAVTRINTDERVVVGETYYDYNGRPVIQMLPVPVETANDAEPNDFYYRPGFNRIDPNKERIEKAEYDKGEISSSCSPIVPTFSNEYGASRYYSGENNFGTNEDNKGQEILNKDLIPDSKLYPYTQTQYRNDNTNRIAAQSGVGEAHTLDSGHETKYLYASPGQTELNRLFGRQVGRSAFYKKNTIIDPNGQVSVSYMNPEGKVVATALAGDEVQGLESLEGENGRTVNEQLLNNETNRPNSDRKQKIFVKNFPVTTKGTYQFNYELTPGKHTVLCKVPDTDTEIAVEMVGVFDVTLELFDNCNVYFSETLQTDASTFAPNATPQLYELSPENDPFLEVGEYTLSKKLSINQEKLDLYLDEYLGNSNYSCVLSQSDFIPDLENLDLATCGWTCEQCREELEGTIERLEDDGNIVTAAEKSRILSRCDVFCLDGLTCKASLFSMLSHFTPDAQYAGLRDNQAIGDFVDVPAKDDLNNDLDVNDFSNDVSVQENPDGQVTLSPNGNSDIVPENFPLSIFNDKNSLITNLSIRGSNEELCKPTWRVPVKIVKTGFETANQANQINQVLFDEDLSGADVSYEVTNYYDLDGKIIYARGSKQDLEDLTDEDSKVVPLKRDGTEAMTGEEVFQYGLPIKYLREVKDFLPYWQEHFANYMLPYHPEYSYYVECTSRKMIHGYNEEMFGLELPSSPDFDKFLVLEPGQGDEPDYYVPDIANIINNDPFFDDPEDLKDFSGNVIQVNGFDDKYKTILENKMTNFRPIAGSSGIATGAFNSMAKEATMVVNCPNPDAPCKRDNCDIGKFEADDQEEWAAFRQFYTGERYKLLKQISTEKAIQGSYFNGCIGVKEFQGSEEQSKMNRNGDLVFTFNSDNYEFDCEATPYTSYANRWFRWYGFANTLRVNNFSNWTNYWTRRGVLKTIDPNQTCSANRAPFYEEKIRSFYPSTPGGEAGESLASDCFELVENSLGNLTYLRTECNYGMLEKVEELDKAAKIKEFSDCGNCPKTTELQDFLTEIIEGNQFISSVNDFNCFTSNANYDLGIELNNLVTDDRTDLLNWDGTYDVSSKTVKGVVSVAPLGTSGRRLEIELDFSSFNLSALISEPEMAKLFNSATVARVAASDLANPTEAELYLDFEYNKFVPNKIENLFALLGSDYPIDEDENEAFRRYQLRVPLKLTQVLLDNSEIDVNLAQCTLDSYCQTNALANRVMALLNDLTYQDDTDINGEVAKTYDLNRPSNDQLEIKEFDYYEASARRLLKLDEFNNEGEFLNTLDDKNVVWSAETATINDFKGVLTYEGSKKVNLILKPANLSVANNVDFSLNNIDRFKNIEPFRDADCNNSACMKNKFYVDAVVKEDISYDGATVQNASVYHKVVVEIITDGNGDGTNEMPTVTVCRK